jgi:outer membrane lipoprotein-sorting protein
MRAILLFILYFICSFAHGQSAKQVLDKAAAAVSNRSGITASFTLKGGQMNDKGTISIKGKMFQINTPDVVIWFDGKTQWSYVRKNDEVNVSNPKESQLQSLNPYNFIYMYKKGYNSTLNKKDGNYEVHLTATDKRKSVQEMYLTINPKTYIPSVIRIKHPKGWNTIEVNNVKKANLSDGIFHFNSKDFPTAEVIDLR